MSLIFEVVSTTGTLLLREASVVISDVVSRLWLYRLIFFFLLFVVVRLYLNTHTVVGFVTSSRRNTPSHRL